MFRNPTMRVILTAEGISALGTQMSFFALPWLVLVRTAGSATHMGFVLGAQVLPAALLGIPSAIVVQRLGVRRTLLIADGCRAPLFAAIALLQLAHLLSFPLLLVIVFAIGVFTAPYLSAQRLLIPETFADDESLVVRGNAVIEGVVRLAMLLGPAAAGLAIKELRVEDVLLIDALSYVIAFVILWRGLPPTAAPPARVIRPLVLAGAVSEPGGGVATATPAPQTSTVDSSGVFAGARFAFADPLLRRVAAASFTFGLFFPPLLASLPVLALRRYAGDPRVAGLLLAAMGLGALIGTIVVIPLSRIPAMRLGAIGAVGLAAPLWLLVFDLRLWQFGLVMLACGVFTPVLNAPVLTQIMLRAPAELRPKVLTFVLSTNLIAGPVAFALTGPALDRWDFTSFYVVIALGVSVAASLLATMRPEQGGPSAN